MARTPPTPVVLQASRWIDRRWVTGFAVVFTQDGHPRIQWRPTRSQARRLADRIVRRRTRDAA